MPKYIWYLTEGEPSCFELSFGIFRSKIWITLQIFKAVFIPSYASSHECNALCFLTNFLVVQMFFINFVRDVLCLLLAISYLCVQKLFNCKNSYHWHVRSVNNDSLSAIFACIAHCIAFSLRTTKIPRKVHGKAPEFGWNMMCVFTFIL